MEYIGENLTIRHDPETSTFYQTWIITEGLDIVQFKNEMLEYVKAYELKRPKNAIWDQTNFTLQLTPEDYLWIEKNVNIPGVEFGNEKCAFVVGADVLAHITVMDSFDEVESCIEPRHFGSIEEAEAWIRDESNIQGNELDIKFDGTNEEGKSVFQITSESNDVKKVLKNLKNVIEEQEFFKQNRDRFLSLSSRERIILKLFGEGKSIKEIAIDDQVSIHTVRTQWKNIKKKLNIQTTAEALNYYNVFLL